MISLVLLMLVGISQADSADVEIKPDTVNLNSNSKWITAFITIPDGYTYDGDTDVKLEVDGLAVEGMICPQSTDSLLIAKFPKEKFRSLILGTYTATVTIDDTLTGEDELNLVEKGHRKSSK